MFTFSSFVDSRPFYISFYPHLRCVFGVKTETRLRNFLVGSAKIDSLSIVNLLQPYVPQRLFNRSIASDGLFQ